MASAIALRQIEHCNLQAAADVHQAFIIQQLTPPRLWPKGLKGNLLQNFAPPSLVKDLESRNEDDRRRVHVLMLGDGPN
jgi:hypothetical protein